jgi:hypothetical protein
MYGRKYEIFREMQQPNGMIFTNIYHQTAASLDKTLLSSHYDRDNFRVTWQYSAQAGLRVLKSSHPRRICLIWFLAAAWFLALSFTNKSRGSGDQIRPPPPYPAQPYHTSIIQHVQPDWDISIRPTPHLAASRPVLTAIALYTQSATSVPQLLRVDTVRHMSSCPWH